MRLSEQFAVLRARVHVHDGADPRQVGAARKRAGRVQVARDEADALLQPAAATCFRAIGIVCGRSNSVALADGRGAQEGDGPGPGPSADIQQMPERRRSDALDQLRGQ